MVDLRLPKPTTAVDEMPQSRVSANDVYRSGMALAKGVSDLSSGLEDVGVEYAKKAGEEAAQKAIQRNPDGSLTVTTPDTSFLFGRMGNAYKDAATAGVLTATRSDMDMKLAEMAQKYQGDPQGFRVAAGAYVDSKAEAGGELGAIAFKYGQTALGQHYGALVDGQARRDVQSSLGTLSSRLKMKEDEIDGLTAQGDTSSPAYVGAVAERRAIQENLIANPLFNYSKEQRDVDDQLYHTRLQETAIVSRGRAVFDATKNLDQAVGTVEAEIDKLPISQDRKIQLMGKLRQNLTGMAAVRTQINQQLKDKSQTTIQNIQLTGTVDQNAVEQQASELERNRLFADATALRKAAMVPKYTSSIMRGSPAEARAALQEIQAGAVKRGGPPMRMDISTDQRDLMIRTIAGEAGGEGEQGQEAVAHVIRNRVASGEYGRGVRGVIMAPKQFSVWNPGDPAGDIARKLQPGSPQYEAIGAVVDRVMLGQSSDPTNGAQHYANPLTADKSNVEGWIKDKAAVGKVTIGNHVFVGGTGATESVSTESAAYRALLKDTQTLYNTRTKTMLQGIREAYQQPGYSPTKQELDDLMTMIPNVTDNDLRQEVSTILKQEAVKGAARGMPIAAQQELVRNGELAAQAGNATAVERDLVTALKKDVEINEKLAKDDPVAYAQRAIPDEVKRQLPPVTPLDFSSPQGMSQSLDQRRQWAGYARAMDSQVGKMPLTGSDIQQITTAIPNMPVDQVQNVLSGLAQTLRPDELQAVLENKDMKASIVGLTRSGDAGRMTAAFSFLDSQSRENPVAFRATFGTDVEKNLGLWKAYVAFKTPDEIAKIIQKRDDPGARDSYKEAESVASDVTPEQVVKKFGTWVPYMSPGAPLTDQPAAAAAGLARDYRMHFADFYSGVADKTAADAYAMEQVQKKWGQTKVGGNRIMAYPPEKVYPQVDGSHDYINKQLDDAIRETAGIAPSTTASDMDAFLASPMDNGGSANYSSSQTNRYAAARSLLGDATTEADIKANRPPSYQVVVVDPNGRPRLLMDDKSGRPLRFRADPAAAQQPVSDAFDTRQRQELDARAAGAEQARQNAEAMRLKMGPQ